MSARVQCQVCRRGLVPRADGTSRHHKSFRGAEDYCSGSGYRLDRWPVGQRLQHYTGQVWEVEAQRTPSHGWPGYDMRCIVQTMPTDRPEGTVEHFHAEHLHRHGWTPVVDLMRDLQRSLGAAKGSR